MKLYGITKQGNWEGKNILHKNHDNVKDVCNAKLLDKIKSNLLKERSHRVSPGRDDKILTDWNALLIDALVSASLVFNNEDWLQMAISSFDFIYKNMFKDNELFHSSYKGHLKQRALLEDYANLSLASLSLYSATGNKEYLNQCQQLIAIADKLFLNNESGIYYKTRIQEDLIVRLKEKYDNVTPIGNGIILQVFAKLYYYTNENIYYEKAKNIIKALYNSESNISNMCTITKGIELLENAKHITLFNIKNLDDQLFQVVAKFPNSNIILEQKASSSNDRYALFCYQGKCLPKIYTPQELEAILKDISK